MEIPFVGGSYEGKSKNLNAQVCQNLYPVVDQQGGKSVLGLYNVPGTTSYINLGEGNRYLVQLSGNLYFDKNEDILTLPQLDYLIGWYKFDEGSGTVVNNYATDGSLGGGLLPNLNVYNIGDFWSHLSGFGSTADVSNANHAYIKFASRPLTVSPPGHSIGQFYRRKVDAAAWGGYSINIHFTFVSFSGLISPWNNNVNSVTFALGSTGPSIANACDLTSWYFYFVSQEGLGRAVKSDGTLMSTDTTVPIEEYDIQYLHVGVMTGDDSATGGGPGSSGAQGSYGDTIIYNSYMPTLSEWGQWYDQLRSRYGMAARSGW